MSAAEIVPRHVLVAEKILRTVGEGDRDVTQNIALARGLTRPDAGRVMIANQAFIGNQRSVGFILQKEPSGPVEDEQNISASEILV